MKRFFAIAVLAVATLALAAAALAAHGGGGGVPLGAMALTGAEECSAPGVCGVGDPDGTGSFIARVNVGQGEVCYELSVAGIATPTAAHIHVAPAGRPGPVVVPLITPSTGSSAGCASVSRELARALIADPAAYYVNVHNAPYPGGAVRGQLTRVAPGQFD